MSHNGFVRNRSNMIDEAPVLCDKLEFGSGACARAMRHVVPLSHRRQAVFMRSASCAFIRPNGRIYIHALRVIH